MKINRNLRKFRSIEKRFLQRYSAWQETHRFELASEALHLLSQLLHLNPNYSARHTFDRAF